MRHLLPGVGSSAWRRMGTLESRCWAGRLICCMEHCKLFHITDRNQGPPLHQLGFGHSEFTLPFSQPPPPCDRIILIVNIT